MTKAKLNLNSQSGSAHIIIAVIVAILLILGALGYIFWQNFVVKTQNNNADTSSKQANTKENLSTDQTPAFDTQATITGEVRYPIEWISLAQRNKGMIVPSDFKVCAIDPVTSKEVACDQGFSESESSYSVQVPAGRYFITATTGNVTAYYDLYVKDNPNNAYSFDPCAAATSSPIAVTVAGGDTVTKIDAADFWVGHTGC